VKVFATKTRRHEEENPFVFFFVLLRDFVASFGELMPDGRDRHGDRP
jgi:hypothetical protein